MTQELEDKTPVDFEFVAPGDAERTQYVLDVVSARLPVSQAKVLDLACRTGAFSRKLAAAGATVVGVEGKPENFNQIPATEGTHYVLADVRDLDVLELEWDKYDVILCLGLMYHFEACDACRLLHNMRARIEHRGIVILDTHVGGRSRRITIDGVVYNGDIYDEGIPGPWSSLGNDESFWFSKESLHHLCRAAGWTVEELPGPDWAGVEPGRHWMVLS